MGHTDGAGTGTCSCTMDRTLGCTGDRDTWPDWGQGQSAAPGVGTCGRSGNRNMWLRQGRGHVAAPGTGPRTALGTEPTRPWPRHLPPARGRAGTPSGLGLTGDPRPPQPIPMPGGPRGLGDSAGAPLRPVGPKGREAAVTAPSPPSLLRPGKSPPQTHVLMLCRNRGERLTSTAGAGTGWQPRRGLGCCHRAWAWARFPRRGASSWPRALGGWRGLGDRRGQSALAPCHGSGSSGASRCCLALHGSLPR